MGGMAALASYLLLVIAIVGFLLGITHVLGERHMQRGTGIPYESGELPTGSARVRFSGRFLPRRRCFSSSSTPLRSSSSPGPSPPASSAGPAIAAMLAFLLETVAALAYLWRTGAFDWGKIRAAEH